MQRFQTKLRVTYKDTDQMGVVYYSNYFVWFEIARTEFFRSLKISYKDIEKNGLYLMVVEASCKYLAPTRYDDLITLECWVEEARKTSLLFSYLIKTDSKVLAEGKTAHVFTDKDCKPTRMPDYLKELLT